MLHEEDDELAYPFKGLIGETKSSMCVGMPGQIVEITDPLR